MIPQLLFYLTKYDSKNIVSTVSATQFVTYDNGIWKTVTLILISHNHIHVHVRVDEHVHVQYVHSHCLERQLFLWGHSTRMLNVIIHRKLWSIWRRFQTNEQYYVIGLMIQPPPTHTNFEALLLIMIRCVNLKVENGARSMACLSIWKRYNIQGKRCPILEI